MALHRSTFLLLISFGLCIAACSKEDEPPPPPYTPPPPGITPDQLSAGWSYVSPGLGRLNDLYFLNDSMGYLGGEKIARTTDSGRTWKVVKPALNSFTRYNIIFFLKPAIGWAMTNELVFKTTDSGATWQNQTPVFVKEDQSTLYDIQFADEKVGFISSDKGAYRSGDGGATWTRVAGIAISPALSLVSPTVGWIGTHNPIGVSATTDGINFAKQTIGTTTQVSSIYFTSDKVGWVVEINGGLWRTTDGGASYAKKRTGTKESANDIHFFDANTGYLSTERELYKVEPDGVTPDVFKYTPVVSLKDQTIYEIFFTNANIGWAITGEGNLLRYVNK